MVSHFGQQRSGRKTSTTYAVFAGALTFQGVGGYLNPIEGTNVVATKFNVTRSEMVPIIGFELMTYRLQGGCSTN